MKPRHFRILLTCCIFIGTSTTIALTVFAFRQELLFFYTPSQVFNEEIDRTRSFRLGGLVAPDSVHREIGSLVVQFEVTDMANTIPVSYTGVLPDLFREGKGIIVQGRWHNNHVIADEVLAKHDENYMPPEVQTTLNNIK